MMKKTLISVFALFLLSSGMAFAASPAQDLANALKGNVVQAAVAKINPDYLLQIDELLNENNAFVNDLKESATAVKEGYASLENKDTIGVMKNILVLKENEESLKKVWDFLEVDKLLQKLQTLQS